MGAYLVFFVLCAVMMYFNAYYGHTVWAMVFAFFFGAMSSKFFLHYMFGRLP